MGLLFDKIPDEHRETCRHWAKVAVEANPKLVKEYINGHSAVVDLTEYATKKGATIDERWIAEYIVVELEKIRSEGIETRKGPARIVRKGPQIT